MVWYLMPSEVDLRESRAGFVKRVVQILMLVCTFAGFSLSHAGQPDAQNIATQPIVITDIAGRTVTLPKPASRVVLTQARYFPVLGMIHPDPVSILAGWSDEFKNSYAEEYAEYQRRFPAIERIPVVGQHTAASFSVERALAVKPDVVTMTAAFAGIRPNTGNAAANSSPLIRRFEAAGVPVVVVDFFIDPLNNTVPSMRILGQVLGYPERAQAFISYYEAHMQRIAQGVATLKHRPDVLVHAHAGATGCCNSPGVGTFNEMIQYAGGHNIGEDVLQTPTGQLGLEYIIRRNPAVYVATGTGSNRLKGLVVGADVAPADAQQSLRRVVQQSRLQPIMAVQSGNAHGIWHGFNDSPLNVVFIEALATWINPDAFSDVSAQKTLDEISERFLLVPMRGTYLIDWEKP